MPGTPGENATPSQQEGASEASPPEHGEGVAGTSHAQGAGGEVISEGASQAGAGGDAVSGAQAEASDGAADAPGAPVEAGGGTVDASSGGTDASTAAVTGSESGTGGEATAAAATNPDAGAASGAGGDGASTNPEAGTGGATEGASATSPDAGASSGTTGETGAPSEAGTGSEASAEQSGPGRYVELPSGGDVADAPGEPKDEARSGPVSGVDAALLSAGIWDVASRASQEEAPGPDGGSDKAVATPDEEPLAEAVEPRVMGQVTAMVLPLERLEEDTTFRLRDEGDVSELATDLARLGQLFPVDVRPRGEERYQLICGFRRVAALRFLKRDQVQVRVHEELSDEDALLLSLAEAIHASPVEHDTLEAKRDSLEAEGRLTAPVRDMLEKALATEETLAPEGVEEEIDADELAADVAQRMGALNQDLSLLADVFSSLDESRRAELLMQVRYSAELVKYLEGL
ncbi:chromosome partitioning protein ParB [Corallococcus praedator]|uniref:Chromosome partitioning protein ParB n=1 Tax=Corallococcus praedator TaxID=2316724 RepID=A0ABX9QMM8_9BACT|nr:chromosome partitioning protein ParB [Corallococcus sp. CA031C]RKI13745.1 chromosome partitioning protein ParB [Corallococcus praedator]